MSRNGHDGEGLPGSLAAFMLSHLNMHSDPGEYIKIPSVDASVESVDAVLKAQTEMLRMMAEKGYPADQIKAVISALGEKSTDGKSKSTDDRQTKDDLAILKRRRERDRKYQEKRRAKVKVPSVDAPKTDIYTNTSLPFLEVDNDKKESKSSGIRARGCRLPRDFQLTDERRAFALTQLPDNRIKPEFEKFCDYWWGKSGSGATKVDWDGTWRNWCRTAAERNGNARSGSGVSNSQPRKENGAQRAVRLAREASARQSGAGLSGSGERVVDLDASEWTEGHLPGINGRGTGNL